MSVYGCKRPTVQFITWVCCTCMTTFLPPPRWLCNRHCLPVCLSVCLLAALCKNFWTGLREKGPYFWDAVYNVSEDEAGDVGGWNTMCQTGTGEDFSSAQDDWIGQCMIVYYTPMKLSHYFSYSGIILSARTNNDCLLRLVLVPDLFC